LSSEVLLKRLTAGLVLARSGIYRAMRFVTGGNGGGVRFVVTMAAILTLCSTITYSQSKPQRTQWRTWPTVTAEEIEPMAIKTWVSTDGNLNAAASWYPSGVPTGDDSIYFNDSSQVDVVSGLTALTAIDITRIWIQPTYGGNIGAHGNPLAVQAARVIHQGSGSFYYSHKTHSGYAGQIYVDSPNLQDAFHLAATQNTAAWLYLRSGGANIANNTTIGAIFVIPGGINQVFLTIGSGCIYIAEYHQTGGTVTTKSELGHTSGAIIDGGLLVVDKSTTPTWDYLTLTGGTVQYNGSGNIIYATLMGGTLDMAQDNRAKNISVLRAYPGANFLTHDDITVLIPIDLRPDVPILDGP
jgi:hypothetical protein